MIASSAKMEVYREAKSLLEKKELKSSFKCFTNFIDSQEGLTLPECREELTDAYNSRGHIRYLWVDFDEAVEDYSAALELDSNFAVAYYNRGQVHYRLGRFEMAKSDLEKCVQLDPSFTDAEINLEQVEVDLQKNRDKLTVGN